MHRTGGSTAAGGRGGREGGGERGRGGREEGRGREGRGEVEGRKVNWGRGRCTRWREEFEEVTTYPIFKDVFHRAALHNEEVKGHV